MGYGGNAPSPMKNSVDGKPVSLASNATHNRLILDKTELLGVAMNLYNWNECLGRNA